MKIFKRIMAFMMAMIIFASFFCYNTGAANNPNYAHYEYTGNYVRAFFSGTSAYAFARITDWAEEDNTTDLRASTYAHINDYIDLNYFYDVVVSASLWVYLEDDSENYVEAIGYVEPDEGTVDALVHGRNCLNYDDHYSIEDFTSGHEVKIYFRIFDEYGDELYEYSENDGPYIEISTMD